MPTRAQVVQELGEWLDWFSVEEKDGYLSLYAKPGDWIPDDVFKPLMEHARQIGGSYDSVHRAIRIPLEQTAPQPVTEHSADFTTADRLDGAPKSGPPPIREQPRFTPPEEMPRRPDGRVDIEAYAGLKQAGEAIKATTEISGVATSAFSLTKQPDKPVQKPVEKPKESVPPFQTTAVAEVVTESKTLETLDLDALAGRILAIMQQTRTNVKKELLKAKWLIGKEIFSLRVNYNNSTFDGLAEKTGIAHPELVFCWQFYKKYPESTYEVKAWRKIIAELPDKIEAPTKPILPSLPSKAYHTIVIDPPWPVEKIDRVERPNQGIDLDYATFSIFDIAYQPIEQLADPSGCHIYLWVTQKHLADGLELFKKWNVRYQCELTWVKNVGMTPFSWMYSTEHILFGRIGNLDLLENGKRLDFKADVREHSRKPDEFYDLVRVVSPEPRLDMFSREKREGFDQYGDETGKFTEAA